MCAGGKSQKKPSQYKKTSRKVTKSINGVSRERNVWVNNKNNKDYVKVKLDGKFTFKLC